MADFSSREEVTAQVKEIVAEILKVSPDELSETAVFVDLGADSLDRITMVMSLEDAIDREISDDEAKLCTNVENTVDFILGKMAKSGDM